MNNQKLIQEIEAIDKELKEKQQFLEVKKQKLFELQQLTDQEEEIKQQYSHYQQERKRKLAEMQTLDEEEKVIEEQYKKLREKSNRKNPQVQN